MANVRNLAALFSKRGRIGRKAFYESLHVDPIYLGAYNLGSVLSAQGKRPNPRDLRFRQHAQSEERDTFPALGLLS